MHTKSKVMCNHLAFCEHSEWKQELINYLKIVLNKLADMWLSLYTWYINYNIHSEKAH